MQWVPDRSGRFRLRPHFHPAEIDALCERRIERFLMDRYGTVSYPVSTADLTVLIEQDAGDLDLYADLATMDYDRDEVEGATTFFADRPPRVEIARSLSEEPRREARLRTTLAHELGHVLLHDFARTRPGPWQSVQSSERTPQPLTACKPGKVIGTHRVDWLEWQAGYAGGALLIPREAALAVLRPLGVGSVDATATAGVGRCIDELRNGFMVSEAAAYVRLRQLQQHEQV